MGNFFIQLVICATLLAILPLCLVLIETVVKGVLSFKYRVRVVCEVVSQGRYVEYVNSPYVALFHRKTTRVTTLYAPWTTPSVTVARNLYVHACIHLHMLTVLNSVAEILIILNFHRTCKVMDVWPLCHKVTYEPQTVVEGHSCRL